MVGRIVIHLNMSLNNDTNTDVDIELTRIWVSS